MRCSGCSSAGALQAHEQPFVQRLGAGGIEGSQAAALGGLWRYADSLRRLRDALRQPLRPEAWSQVLNRALDDFLAPDAADLDELRALRQTLQQLVDDMQRGGLDAALPLPVLRAALQARLDDPARGGAAGGSINFASLHALRGLPFRGGVPDRPERRRLERAPRRRFDLMAQHPRRATATGATTRGLMLDLLLARDGLYLSHTGRSVRDNAPLPPSVLVSELMDLLLPAIAGGGPTRGTGWWSSIRCRPLRWPRSAPMPTRGCAASTANWPTRCAAACRPGAAGRHGGRSGAGEDDDDDEGRVRAMQTPFFGAPLLPPGPRWRQVTLAQLTLPAQPQPHACCAAGWASHCPAGRRAAGRRAAAARRTRAAAPGERLLPALRGGADVDRCRRWHRRAWNCPKATSARCSCRRS